MSDGDHTLTAASFGVPRNDDGSLDKKGLQFQLILEPCARSTSMVIDLAHVAGLEDAASLAKDLWERQKPYVVSRVGHSRDCLKAEIRMGQRIEAGIRKLISPQRDTGGDEV